MLPTMLPTVIDQNDAHQPSPNTTGSHPRMMIAKQVFAPKKSALISKGVELRSRNGMWSTPRVSIRPTASRPTPSMMASFPSSCMVPPSGGRVPPGSLCERELPGPLEKSHDGHTIPRGEVAVRLQGAELQLHIDPPGGLLPEPGPGIEGERAEILARLLPPVHPAEEEVPGPDVLEPDAAEAGGNPAIGLHLVHADVGGAVVRDALVGGPHRELRDDVRLIADGVGLGVLGKLASPPSGPPGDHVHLRVGHDPPSARLDQVAEHLAQVLLEVPQRLLVQRQWAAPGMA